MKKFVEVSRGVYRDPELPVVAASTGEWKQWSEKGWQSVCFFYYGSRLTPAGCCPSKDRMEKG